MLLEALIRRQSCKLPVASGWRALDPHNRDLGESLFECGWLELGCHALDEVFFYLAFTATVTVQTHFKWYIKEYRVNLITKAFSHLDPLATLVRSQVGGVHIIPGHAGDQTGT